MSVPKSNANYRNCVPFFPDVAAALKKKKNCWIHGIDGVGKSSLAIETLHAHILKKNNKITPGIDGVAFVQIRPKMDLSYIFMIICGAGAVSFDTGNPIKSVMAVAKKMKLLVVIDGLEDPTLCAPLFRLDFLFLVTAVFRPGTNAFTLFHLHPPNENQVAKIVPRLSKTKAKTLFPKIVAITGKMPLALIFIENVRNVLGVLNIVALGQIIRDSVHLRHDEWNHPKRLFVQIASTVEAALNYIDDELTHIFKVLGNLAFSPFPTTVFIRLCGELRIPCRKRQLDVLEQLGLIAQSKKDDSLYVRHIVFYRYARQIATTGLLHRILRRCLHREFFEISTGSDRQTVALLGIHIHSLIGDTDVFGIDGEFIERILKLAKFYTETRQFYNAIQIYEQGIKKVTTVQNHTAEGQFYGNLGLVYIEKDRLSEARVAFERSLLAFNRAKNEYHASFALRNLGLVYKNMEQYDDSLNYYLDALSIHEKIGDTKTSIKTLRDIGTLYGLGGNAKKKMRYYLLALDVALHTNESQEKRHLFILLSFLFEEEEEYADALTYFEFALGAFSAESNNRECTDMDMYRLKAGHLSTLAGEYKKSKSYFQRVIERSEKSGNTTLESAGYDALGALHYQLSDCKSALQYFRKGYVLSPERDKKTVFANYLTNRGMAENGLGNEKKAQRCWKKALSLFESENSPESDTIKKWLLDRVE